MSPYKILLLLGAISFLIGAMLPMFTARSIGWQNLGLAFVTFAVFVGSH